MKKKPRSSILVLGLLAHLALPAAALELHPDRASAYDLALTGRLEGVPAGEMRYLRRGDLQALPTRKLKLTGEFVPGEQEVTVVMLDDLLTRLPRAADADALIATCNDGYASIYTSEFISTYKPFLVMEINGRGPEQWPPEGLTFNPGPFVISITDSLAPGASKLLDAAHKRPWGVHTIEFARYSERFATLYSGALKEPSPLAVQGREIWVNSCFSCHNQPHENLGGTKAARPLQIVATHAVYNTPYFKDYVRDPKKLNPLAKMEPHAHYTDAHLDALVAFLKLTVAQ